MRSALALLFVAVFLSGCFFPDPDYGHGRWHGGGDWHHGGGYYHH